MFKKLAYFTDIHHGRSLNNPVALKDNVDFVDWFIEEAKTRGCETFIFGGDWFDNRHTINVNTSHTALQCLEKLSDAFEQSYFILGNHDLYFRSRRSISSVAFAKHVPKITIVDKPTFIGDVTLLPWLCGDEQDNIANQGRYTFAHLEMSGFLMNAKVAMPEGEHVLKADVFSKHEYVFTGHFHMRQIAKNIVYTGNIMPFDFSDNWDAERGAMFLDWGGEPEFMAWPEQPLFRTMNLSDMLNEPGRYLKDRLTARVAIDVDISYEEAQVIKQTFMDDYRMRKMELVPIVRQDEKQSFDTNVEFQSIDQIVTDGLMAVQSSGLDNAKLIEIYRSLA